MKNLIPACMALFAIAPAHAVSVVSLHTGAPTWTGTFSTSTVSAAVLAVGMVALGTVVALRVIRRRSK